MNVKLLRETASKPIKSWHVVHHPPLTNPNVACGAAPESFMVLSHKLGMNADVSDCAAPVRYAMDR